MKMLVCVKQVPDMESRFRINTAGTWIDEADLAYRMNEYDEFAVEQAVRVKEQLGGQADLTVLSLGPARVTEVLKKALAMGADRGVHVLDEHSSQKDPWQIASIIYTFAKETQFDLIFTGMQSQDRGSAQVGVFVAEQLGIPCITTVVGFTLDGSRVTAVRELEGGLKMTVACTLPALITCQLGLNLPRYPTLPNIMKAKQKELLVVPVADVLKDDARTKCERIIFPEKKTSGLILEGDPKDAAARLAVVLKEKTAVLRK
jgi:electron transfer flavoprotein beta subunit